MLNLPAISHLHPPFTHVRNYPSTFAATNSKISLDHFIWLADSLVEFDYDSTDNRYPLTSLHAIDLHRSDIKTTWSRIKSAYEKFLLDLENEQKISEKDKTKGQSPTDLEPLKVTYKSTFTYYVL